MASSLVWALANRIYRSPGIARALFGVRVSPIGPEDHYFDVTTWVLLRRALEEVRRDSRVIDLGTGSQALIGLALARQRGCQVIAVDVDPILAEAARRNVERNGAAIEVVESNLLDAVAEPFDLVLFNPPYVPTGEGERRSLPSSRRTQWDGGADGLETVRGFLKALTARTHPLRCCLGINSMHADVGLVRGLIAEHPTLVLEREHHHPLLPVSVYVLGKR